MIFNLAWIGGLTGLGSQKDRRIAELEAAWRAEEYECGRLEREIERLRRENEAALKQLGRVLEHQRIEALNAETDGPKRDLEKSNDAQAARAMSRNLKADFVQYQEAVKNIMAQFDKVMKKNSITKKDLDTINSVREQMRAIVKREL